MSIELPSFEKSYGRIMTACGELKQQGSRTGKGGERKPKVQGIRNMQRNYNNQVGRGDINKEEKINIKIEPARIEDEPRILEILRIYNMGEFGHAERKEMPKIEHFLVAKNGDFIVGCCAYLLSDESEIANYATEAETGSLAVIPEYRGKGIGASLQTARMSKLCKIGIKKLYTEVDRPERIDWYIRKFAYRKILTRKKKYLNFGDPTVDTFTLLAVDLEKWDRHRRAST